MFKGCTALTGVGYMNTEAGTDFEYMFSDLAKGELTDGDVVPEEQGAGDTGPDGENAVTETSQAEESTDEVVPILRIEIVRKADAVDSGQAPSLGE